MTPRAKKTLRRGAVVLTVLFLLIAAAVLLVLNPYRVARTQAILAMYSMASSNYSAFGHWPKAVEEINTNAARMNWVVQGLPSTDGWGRPIVYEAFDAAKGFGRAISYGRDGKPGGTGVDADLESRFGK
jgi:hypothetical protein